MGARGATTKYENRVSLKLAQADRNLLDTFASLYGVSVNQVIRLFIREALDRRRPRNTPPEIALGEVLDILEQFDRALRPAPEDRELATLQRIGDDSLTKMLKDKFLEQDLYPKSERKQLRWARQMIKMVNDINNLGGGR
jgi:hypothetical protein